MNPRFLIIAVVLIVASACDHQTDVPSPTVEGLDPATGDEAL